MKVKSFVQLPFATGILILLLFASDAVAQKKDTIRIDAGKINTGVLREGVHRYLVYFKNGKDSSRNNVSFWTRTLSFIDYHDRPAIRIAQEWEDKDSIVHTVESICDRKTFAPLYQTSWWKQMGNYTFDFLEKTGSIQGKPLSDADTARRRADTWQAFKQALNQYVLNWHLDLEVFPVLPYRNGVTFLIPFYDPGFPAPRDVAYTVTGSAKLTGYDNQSIDCWLLTHESKGNKEVFWVSKKTHEVLRLEQAINNRFFRYKVKFAFSN